MLQIDRIELSEISLPLVEPFRISSGVATTRRILLLHLFTAEGAEGWSECVAGESPNYSPETIDTAWLALREWIAPRLLGHRFAGPEEVQPHLDENFRGHNMAKAAVEMGAWELTAQLQGVSLATLLGGTQRRIPIGISIGIQ